MKASVVKVGVRFLALTVGAALSFPALATEKPKAGAHLSTVQIKNYSLVVGEFKKAFEAHDSNLSMEVAVAELDKMLVQQHAAQGSISSEISPELKSLYEFTAVLLMNGYPIAGGTILSFARSHPDYFKSGVGASYASFVDAMLSPTDEDDGELAELSKRTKKSFKRLKKLPVDIQQAAQVFVLAKIYGDAVAETAGLALISHLPVTPSQRALIESAWK